VLEIALDDDHVRHRRERELREILDGLQPVGVPEVLEVKNVIRLAAERALQGRELPSDLGLDRIAHDHGRHDEVVRTLPGKTTIPGLIDVDAIEHPASVRGGRTGAAYSRPKAGAAV
jgi:hypothetical protein